MKENMPFQFGIASLNLSILRKCRLNLKLVLKPNKLRTSSSEVWDVEFVSDLESGDFEIVRHDKQADLNCGALLLHMIFVARD